MPNKTYIRTGNHYTGSHSELPGYDLDLKQFVVDNAGGGGGSVSIPSTAYATNAAAVAALGTGVLYKSTTLINGSPIILITI